MSVVTLRAADRAQWPAIGNLLQFYFYELSEWYPIAFGEDDFRLGARYGLNVVNPTF